MAEGDFYSIDRLVEFGMSMAVATQMANAMNVSLNTMQVPGTGKPLTSQSMSTYYVALDGKAAGPFDEAELSRLITQGQLTRQTYLWKSGMSDWILAENLPDILKLVALTPPPLPNDVEGSNVDN